MLMFSACFMSMCTWFHNFAVSMQELSLEFLYFQCSFQRLVVVSLTILSPVFLNGSFKFKVIGKSGILRRFIVVLFLLFNQLVLVTTVYFCKF